MPSPTAAGTTQVAAHQAVTAAFCALCRADPAETVSILEARLASRRTASARWASRSALPPTSWRPISGSADVMTPRHSPNASPRSPPPPPPRGHAPWPPGVKAWPLDDESASAEAFEQALAAHAEVPDPFETARTHLLYGERLRRGGQRVEARKHLQIAQTAFTAMDLSAWTARADDGLAATGAKARTRQPQAKEPLTSQETRVALQAANGLSNREIAAALFLSPKTVERHLSSVYRKRGLRSRTELAIAFRAPTPG